MEAMLRNPGDFTDEVYAELKAVRDEFLRQEEYMGSPLNAGDLTDRMRYLEAFETGLDNILQSVEGQKVNRSLGRGIPRDDTYVSQAVEEQIVEDAPASPTAEANPGFLERLFRGRIGENPDAPYHDNIMQAILGKDVAGGDRGSVRRGYDGTGQRYDPASADVRAIARDPFPIPETANQYGQIFRDRVGTDADHAEVRQDAGTEGALVTGSAVAQERGSQPTGEFTPQGPSWSVLNLPEGRNVMPPPHPEPTDTPPIVPERNVEAVEEIQETVEDPSTPGVKDFEQVDAEYEGMYDKNDITAMMQFEHTGRGRESLPRHLMHLLPSEMTEHLKPIREKARKASEGRRKKERLERINNRTNFNRSGRGGIGDTGSFDIKDVFNWNKGGIASYKDGGVSDLISSLNPMGGDPITKALFPEQFKQLQELKPSFLRGSLEEEEEANPYDTIEAWQNRQVKLHREDVRRRRNKKQAGLSSLSQGGVASFDKGGIAEGDPGQGRPSMLERIAARAMLGKRMAAPAATDQYYPDRPEMTSKQKWQAGLSAVSQALRNIKAHPETGLTDYSDVGEGMIKGWEDEVGEMEARRSGQIAARRQQQQDAMKAAIDIQALETSILSGDKVAGEIALQQFKIDNPWSEATIGLIEAEMQRAANFQGEINVQVIRDGLAALQQLAKSNPQAGPQGLAGVDSALAGLISKKRTDQDQPKTK